MSEHFRWVGGVELCYETVGDPRHPTVLLIMGLGLSMDWWRDDFCRDLAAAGFHVVRFDNRDVGRSTHLTGRGISGWEFLTRRPHPVYSLADMADDAARLIAALDPRGAHVVGASLGAMVAQEVAIRHPALTRSQPSLAGARSALGAGAVPHGSLAVARSLVSVMGRPGDGRTGRVTWRRIPDFLRPPAADPVEGMVASFRRIGSAGRTAQDDEDVRVTMRRSLARETGADGSGRQLAACVGERDRTGDLRALTMPALVFHGERDGVISPSGGRATAAAIPGAELVEVPGMGHDLPRHVWPLLIEAISRTAARAETRLP